MACLASIKPEGCRKETIDIELQNTLEVIQCRRFRWSLSGSGCPPRHPLPDGSFRPSEQLNRCGYAVVFIIAAIVYLIFRRQRARGAGRERKPSWKKIRRRFRRPAFAAFAVLTVMIFLGGVIYPPSNYTALTYRLRVLQWLSHGQWYLDSHGQLPDERPRLRHRMADRAAAALHEVRRALFLLNFLPFLLLPGLIFSVFTRLGVRARVAWQWMWLLPTGYDFSAAGRQHRQRHVPDRLCAGGDLLWLRAWKSRQPSDLWHSMLAAALLTGAKASNLPLLLPWAIDFSSPAAVAKKNAATALVVFLAAVGFVSADGDFELLPARRLVGLVHRAHRHGHEKSGRRRLGQRASVAAR